MDLDILKFIIPVALSVGSLGWAILSYRLGVRRAELTRLDTAIAEVKHDVAQEKEAGSTSRAAVTARLAQVEHAITQLPDKETVHKLALDVSDMRGDVRVLNEGMKAVSATAHRVENFLLEAARERR